MTGHVAQPGNYEVKLGTPFAKLLEMAGGMRGGRKLKAVIPGGSSMPVLPADIMMKTDMDYDSIAKAGSMLGSGAVIVMDETHLHGAGARAAVVLLLRGILRPVHALPRGHRLALPHGATASSTARADARTSALLDNVADNIAGRTICALGDAAALPVKSFIKHFRDEFVYHIEHKRCLVHTTSSPSGAAPAAIRKKIEEAA